MKNEVRKGVNVERELNYIKEILDKEEISEQFYAFLRERGELPINAIFYSLFDRNRIIEEC